MKFAILFIVFLLLLSTAQAQNSEPAKPLVRLWETGSGLNVPESVLYDSVSDIIFVSNIAGKSAAKDSTGFIARISTNGKILDSAWVTGIDAPKGMGILNRHLFVSNIDEIVEIDIATATIVKHYPVEGAKFLNDIAINPATGMIFISDSGTGQVYVLLDGKVNLWLQGDMFKGANGLFLRDNLLYIGTSNSILQADIKTGEVLIWMINTGGVDGLYVNSDNRFIFSDWLGSVFIATQRQKPETLLSTAMQRINAADFGIILSKNMILIPTFHDNKVVCYTSPEIK